MGEDFQLFTSLRFDWSLKSVWDSRPRDLGWNSETPSPVYMLTYHRDRLHSAAAHWGWTKATEAIEGRQGLSRLDQFVHSMLKKRLDGRLGSDCEPMRVKILLSRDGELALEHSPVPVAALANLFPDQLPAPNSSDDPRPRNPLSEKLLGPLSLTPPYDVYIDTDFTSPSEFTHFKTTKRAVYDQARRRAGLKPTDTTKEVLIVAKGTGLVMEGSLTTAYFWRAGEWVTPRVSRSLDAPDGAGGQDGTTRRWALERNLAVEGDIQAADVIAGEPVWLSNGVRGFVFGRIRQQSTA